MRKRTVMLPVLIAVVLAAASPAWAEWSTVKAILLPGVGQAQQGHYTKAAVFGGAAIISAVGVFASQINYARAVDQYDTQRRTYIFYPTQLERGQVVSASEINGTYDEMAASFDKVESRQSWRDGFVIALAATYAINLIDVLVSNTETGELGEPPPVSVEMHSQGFRVVRTINF